MKDAFVTYQQDTTGLKSLIHSIPQNKGLGDITKRKKPVSILDIPVREKVQEEIPQKKYTATQIRNWKIQQEKKLLVDNSRYIAPRTNMQLSYTMPEVPGVILPIRTINDTGTDWLTIIIFLSITILASIRYTYHKYLAHLFLSIFNYSTTSRMLQEKNYPVSHGAYRLDIIFYLTFSVFIYQLINIIKWGNALTNLTYYFMVLGMVLLYYFGKKLIFFTLGLLFESTYETTEYLFNLDNFNRTLGIILLPIVMLISFTPVKNPVFIVFTGLAIAIIFNLLLLQRGIFILLKKQFPIFYLILYLCTLEFLPLLLIYKIVVE